MSKFLISLRKNGEYQFSVITDNGQVMMVSEGYTSMAACYNGIESVRKNALDVIKFDRKISSNGKYYFNLKAGNGQIIGTSIMYENENSRDIGMKFVVDNIQNSTIEDQTGTIP
jgi:uncharacterized protein